ncbi:MarR family winged helix-turn-helix transcriptional regulator [Jatrophihabitans sp. YIM 134969]
MSDDVLALERQVCFALAVASRTVNSVYRPLLEPLGLTHPQYLVMLALWDTDRRSLRSLSDTLALDPGTLSPLVKRLESQGYLSRTRDPDDERVLRVALTPAGKALRRQAEEVPPAVVAELGMSLAELERLRKGLDRIIDAARVAG